MSFFTEGESWEEINRCCDNENSTDSVRRTEMEYCLDREHKLEKSGTSESTRTDDRENRIDSMLRLDSEYCLDS
jgi:hypothetical protein